MNEKPVKVDIDFNEALRRIAHVDKYALLSKTSNSGKKKTTPPKKNGVVKVKLKQS